MFSTQGWYNDRRSHRDGTSGKPRGLVYDRNGRLVEEGENDIIQDGQTFRVPMMMMDGAASGGQQRVFIKDAPRVPFPDLSEAQHALAVAACDQAVAELHGRSLTEEEKGRAAAAQHLARMADSRTRQVDAVTSARDAMSRNLQLGWCGGDASRYSPTRSATPTMHRPTIGDAERGHAMADRVIALKEREDYISNAWKGERA